jgi:hypothetical protein
MSQAPLFVLLTPTINVLKNVATHYSKKMVLYVRPLPYNIIITYYYYYYYYYTLYTMAVFFYMSNWSNLAKCCNIDVAFMY